MSAMQEKEQDNNLDQQNGLSTGKKEAEMRAVDNKDNDARV